ncbi:MAG: RNA polymerase subunit sigma-24 [Flavobacteriales bacterium]|nr:RNA polymerase subunit sigma-24 [Flavobacteriales bacterium]
MVDNSHLSDKAKEDLILVQRALENGDPRAFNELMARHRDPVYFMLNEKVNGNKELAKELTIEAFGKAFNKLQYYTPKFAFSTWLYSIAKNNLIDYLRKKKLTTVSLSNMFDSDEENAQVLQIPADILNPEGEFEKKQRIKILRKIVEQLNPNYRTLVKLRYFKEYTYDEIAQELKIPLGTVKAQLHRSREQLFKILSGSQEKI